MVGYLDILFGDKETHLQQFIVIGAFPYAVVGKAFPVIASVGDQSKKTTEAIVALVEFVDGFL